MKTNNIPALITLSAGAVYCIIGLTSDISSFTFTKELLIVLIIFFVIGCIVKAILDRNFKDFSEDEVKDNPEHPGSEQAGTDTENETENINTEEETGNSSEDE